MALGRKISSSDVIIWSGIILGVLDWLTDMIYSANTDFASGALRTASITFVVIQPIWYIFMFIVYIASHEEIETFKERREKLLLAFPYCLLQQFKVMAAFESTNILIYSKFKRRDQFLLLNLENSYRIQIVIELVLETLPQIVIQARNNNETEFWSTFGTISFAISLVMLIKNMALLTVFLVRKFVEHRDSVSLRPQSYSALQKVPKLDKDSMKSMRAYQLDPSAELLDADRNNDIHQIIKQEDEVTDFEQSQQDQKKQQDLFIKGIAQTITKYPHQLFMLNKYGQTPLDIAIEVDHLQSLEKTQDQDSAMSHRNEGSDVEKGKGYFQTGSLYSRSKSGKVIDESQTQMLKQREDRTNKKTSVKKSEWESKIIMLIKMMHKYPNNCSIRFLKKPNRLDLKYERSFTMAVKKNRVNIFERFPKNSINTVYVSMSQLQDIRQYKAQKKTNSQDIITTPLHLACQTSNVEAARILLTDHDYDVNILLYEKNFIYDLLTTGGYEDFSILSNVFKKRKPCVNSGCKLALNQAILRGNQYIIQTMLEHGNPNPYAKDIKGSTPIHVACAKLDFDTFEDLVKIGGDPLLPDHDGNTFLHLLCEGGIKDVEYDFAKMACQQFPIKLTRNNERKTPLNLLRSMNATAGNARGQPNYKRKLQDFLVMILENDPTFEDHEGNNDLHLAIIRGDEDKFESLLKDDFVRTQLNLRNSDGKSPLFLAIEHSREVMFDYLFTTYGEHIDLRSKDTIHGNTALHMACQQQNIEVVRRIYEHDPELCMVPNFSGRSPFFVACQRRNIELLRIFEDWKTQAITVQDYLGENMLFVCAREGDVEIFNWFTGSNSFFRARGQQNYKGQSIEHVVCIEGKTSIVQDIRPKLDTKDYYGNLPIHYTIANNDHQMIMKYFTNGKAYFDLRNFKYETIFHVASKHNSLLSIKTLLGRSVFQEELLKRDFKGDTPIHTAAKSGSLEVLDFFLTSVTPGFLDLENDFGLTPIQALQEKISMLRDKAQDPTSEYKDKDKCFRKLEKLMKVHEFLEDFEDFVTAEKWDALFEIPLAIFLEMCVDPNLKIFMGMHTRSDILGHEEQPVDANNSKGKYSPQPDSLKMKDLKTDKDIELV